MSDEKYIMSSLSNALDILDLLSKRDNIGVMDISKALGISKSSIFKMLYTLEAKGFVRKDHDAKYSLGMKFLEYGFNILNNQSIVEVVRPHIKEIRDKHNETTHLGVIDDDLNVFFMIKESSNASIQMASQIGKKMPYYATAVGKVLISDNLSDELMDRIRGSQFIAFTENTITDSEKFLEHLKMVKKDGYASDMQEYEIGLTCFAMGIKNYTGKTVAAISISGPTDRMTENKKTLLSTLKAQTDSISRELGYILK